MATAPRGRRRFECAVPGSSDQIALEIRRYLNERHVHPGDRLGTEQELANEFGVSRPTLREALRSLSAAQLIRVGRGRTGGIFVARTPSEGMRRVVTESMGFMLAADRVPLEEFLDARVALEVPLTGRAAVRADADVVVRLQDAIDATVGRLPGTPDFDDNDKCFHQIIAATAGNVILHALTGWTLEVLQPSLIRRIHAAVDGAQLIAQHRAILEGIRRNDRAEAERAMRAHLQYLGDILASVSADSARADGSAEE